MRKLLIILILVTGLITTAYAQSEPEVISAENVDRLALIDLIGTGKFDGDPVWLDETTLMVGSSAGMWIFDGFEADPELWEMPDAAIRDAAYHDGKLVTGGDDGFIRVWDVETREMLASWKASDSRMTDITLSADGKVLMSRSGFGGLTGVSWWDMETYTRMAEVSHLDADLTGFDMDGRRVVWASDDEAQLLELTENGVETIRRLGFSENIGSSRWKEIVFVDDQIMLYSNETAYIWDLENNQFEAAGDFAEFTDAVSSGDVALFFDWHADSTISLWNVETHATIFNFYDDENGMGAAFSPDGTQIAIVVEYEMAIFDTASGEKIFTFEELPYEASHLAFHDDTLVLDGQYYFNIATGLPEEPPIQLRDLAVVLDTGPSFTLSTILSSRDNPSIGLYVQSYDGQVDLLVAHNNFIQTATVNGDLIATAARVPGIENESNIIRIWDSNTWKVRGYFEFDYRMIPEVVLSPNNNLIAVAGDNTLPEPSVVEVWQTDPLHPLALLDNFVADVSAMVFSPDEQSLFVATVQGNVYGWQMGETVEPFGTPKRPRNARVVDMKFSINGDLLFVLYENGWLDVWNSADIVVPDKEPLKSIHFGRTASVMDLNEDGTLIAVGDDTLEAWGYSTIWLLGIE